MSLETVLVVYGVTPNTRGADRNRSVTSISSQTSWNHGINWTQILNAYINLFDLKKFLKSFIFGLTL